MNQARQENQFVYDKFRQISKAQFDLSHERKITFDFGQLVPFLVEPTIPGDVFDLGAEVILRMPPLYQPIFSRTNLKLWWFYVPNRLLWRNWTRFISDFASSNQQNTIPTVPVEYVDIDLANNVSIWEYMGMPAPLDGETPTTDTMAINALPYLAYIKIYYDFFINPIVQNYDWEDIYETVTDGDNSSKQWFLDHGFDVSATWADFGVAWRNWNRDYYTSATPTPQAGTGIRIPVFDEAAVTTGNHTLAWNTADGAIYDESAGNVAVQIEGTSGTDGSILANTGGTPRMALDVSGTAGTIAQLRYAHRLQELLERMNRSGNRYRDTLRTVFGTDPMAGVIDFAELIGTTSAVIQITDVMQTATTEINAGADEYVLGDYAGKAMGYASTGGIKVNCAEHGYIFGIINVQPRSSYMQGLPKHFLADTWFDFPVVDFAHIGDEAIENREFVFNFAAAYDAADNTDTWGYIPKYSDYRYRNDVTAGQFRNDQYADWHLTRQWDPTSRPALNGNFLQTRDLTGTGSLPLNIFQITAGEPQVYAYIWNKVIAWRPLPKYAIPMM